MRTCALCLREVASTTRHHLIPRTTHRKKWFKKRFTREQMNTTVPLCKMCHREIHRQIPEKEMAKSYNTLELLRTHPVVGRFLEWLTKHDR